MTDFKELYRTYHDEIVAKRYASPYPLRRYVHAAQYESILQYVSPGMNVLDAGCGEGTLSFLMAEKGAHVTGCDLSEPNIASCKEAMKRNGLTVTFLVADSEDLPFTDSSFDLVVSSHVLEHVPDFDRGLREVMRVTKKRAIVAIPTLCNLCSLVQVGGGWFYLKGLRSFAALPIGLLKMVHALIKKEEGVDETYAGTGAPHVFRFPWILREKAKRLGFSILSHEASSVCLPYVSAALPFIKWLDHYRASPGLRNLGYGTTYVIEKP